MLLILKTIGNRKGDCAWSCSRGQTQPEKICKSQRTNQCHSLRTFYWFVLCNLQIFSGCVCPLEQLHAQSPFLFPIVFSINLIPFFDISSVLAVPSPRLFGYVLLYFTWATARSQELLFVVLACHALRALDSRCRLRTRRRVCICIGSTRCRGISYAWSLAISAWYRWRHRRLSLSLYYSQKSLTHNIGSASALPIIKALKTSFTLGFFELYEKL